MRVERIEDMVGGWFIGDFEPSAFRAKDFEVCFKFHKKGEAWPKHYHKEATEINYLIRGSMSMSGKRLEAGDIFIMEPGMIAEPEFHEDCEMIVVKTPSVPNDKYIVD